MSYLDRFLLLETKDALLDLMSNCVVQTYNLKSKTFGLPQRLTFAAQDYPPASKNDAKAPLYLLRDAVGNEPSFKSYICDYEDSAINYMVLNKSANFCFTWTMNGCTFGIGSPTAQGCVLVSHGNAKGMIEPNSTQPATQAEMARALHGPNVSMLEPPTYRQTGREMATTFGIRDGGIWSFYYQSYSQISGEIRHLGVFPIAQGTNQL